MKSLCIIPIYNEEARLQDLLEKVAITKKNTENLEFLLVDNGSTDSSSKIMISSKMKIIKLEKNYGVGYALIKGLEYAINNNFDTIVHLAGNGKMLPEEIIFFLNKIKKEKYNFVNGSRFLPSGNYKTNPKGRVFLIKILSLFISIIYGKKITDVTCGFRAFDVKIFKDHINFFKKEKFFTYRYEYYTYGKVLQNKNYKSTEIPVTMNYPKKNYSKIKPVIDWIPIILGWIEARLDGKRI